MAELDREPIVSEGQYAVVHAAADETADYWFVAGSSHAVPLEEEAVDDAAAALSRFRDVRSDAEGATTTESAAMSCHSCGKTWTYTGSDDHAVCPGCGTAVPVEGIGP